jgi:hypothetical protein
MLLLGLWQGFVAKVCFKTPSRSGVFVYDCRVKATNKDDDRRSIVRLAQMSTELQPLSVAFLIVVVSEERQTRNCYEEAMLHSLY